MTKRLNIRIGPFLLVHEPARHYPPDPMGILREEYVPAHWVLLHDCWLYGGLTIRELLLDVRKNWKSDRSLVG